MYPELFAVLGKAFGGEDGEFGLPDTRGRFLGHIDQEHPMGTTKGSETVRLTVSHLPPHTHQAISMASGKHHHTYVDAYLAQGTVDGTDLSRNVVGVTAETRESSTLHYRTQQSTWSTTPSDLTTSESESHVHEISVESAGDGEEVSVLPPTTYAAHLFIYSGVERTK